MSGLLANSGRLVVRRVASLVPARGTASTGGQVTKTDSKVPEKAEDSSIKPSYEIVDVAGHTGAKWDSDDYRMARFVDKAKHINPNFAINLIAETPPIACKERVTTCEGGGGPLGHPRVFINLDQPGNHACGYCGLRFYKEDSHHHH